MFDINKWLKSDHCSVINGIKVVIWFQCEVAVARRASQISLSKSIIILNKTLLKLIIHQIVLHCRINNERTIFLFKALDLIIQNIFVYF